MTRHERWALTQILGYPPRKPVARAHHAQRGPARDSERLAWIRQQVCCCGCGRGPCEAAHMGTDGGMGIKASDDTVVPLWWECHRLYHWIGKRAFEQARGISFERLVKVYRLRYREERAA